jgi:hypothetical protein
MSDAIKTKAEVLCWGLRQSRSAEQAYLIQHPTEHKRTGNAGIHMIIKDGSVLNAIYGEKFCERSPYHLEKINNNFWLYKNKIPTCQVSLISAPKWYTERTKDGTLMADVFLQEGIDTLISSIRNNCCYFQDNKQCRFCILGYEKGIGQKKVSHIAETAYVALKENPNYYLHLTGGNTFTPDHGIIYYETYIKAIKQENPKTSLSLEVSPPENIQHLEDIISAGADGFSMNIELWDEVKRKKICPGKSKIKRELYFKSWNKGVELLGKFKISSVLLVGLDTFDSIADGIKQLVPMGVKPVLLPFRPFNSCDLNNLPPPNPRELLQLSAIAGRELIKAGAKVSGLLGCEHCGGCSVENDFLNNGN